MQDEPLSPGAAVQLAQPAHSGAGDVDGSSAEVHDRWRTRFSKARQQSSRFFAGLLHRSDRRRERRREGAEDESGEQLTEEAEGEEGDDEQPRVTFDPFAGAQQRRQRHASESPSSQASFLSRLSPIESQLDLLLCRYNRPAASAASLPLPPFFVLVDATGARGRRLLRWLNAAAESSPSASSSPFSATLAVACAHDVHTAFHAVVALYRRHATPSSPPLRLALAGPDSLLSHLLPVYVSTLTTSPSLPIRVYPIPLYSSSRPFAPSSSRVCAHLASLDNLYLSLFFSSAYQHAFDGASVEAEGAVVLDSIQRYVMDAAVTVKLPLGEVNIESAAAATAHPQQSGERDREREGKEAPHPSVSQRPAIVRPHPAPVDVPPAAEFVSAISLTSPHPNLHAVSAPPHHTVSVAADDSSLHDIEAQATTPPHRVVSAAHSTVTTGERKEERDQHATGRVTLPFVSDVAFLSCSLPRPRTTSDSELHRPSLHPQHSAELQLPEQTAQHSAHIADGRSGHKKSGSVMSTFNKALHSITRTSSAADGGRHSRNATSTVQLPPASALANSSSEGGRTARLGRRRNSDSQTHYRGESAGASAMQAATSSAQESSLPAALMHAPLLNRRVSLSWFTSSGKDKVRRGSLDNGLGGGAAGGGVKLKKSSAKGTFERVLVQRIVDSGSGLQQDRKEHTHKRSFMEQAIHSITHLPAQATLASHSAVTSSSLAASSDHTSALSAASSTPPSSHHSTLSPSELLLLARRRPPKESSLLHRLRDDSSHLAKPVTKVLVSAPTPEQSHSSAASASSSSAHVHAQSSSIADLSCVVDGVEVVGVSVVSVSAQVSGRVKVLAVQLFSAPSAASS